MMSKKGVVASVLSASTVNCMQGSMELMCSRNWCLYSAFWVTKMSSTYLYHNLGGCSSVYGLGFKFFHAQVGHNEAHGGIHGCTMYLFIILTLDEEIGIFETECQQCDDVIYGNGGSVM